MSDAENYSSDEYSSGDETPVEVAPKPSVNPALKSKIPNLTVKEEASNVTSGQELDKESLGADVQVVIEMPNGERKTHTFKMGHTVEYLKLVIESEYDIAFSKQELYLDGQLMADPLSLTDYPSINAGDINVITLKTK
eukprot:GEZU01037410.1.p1 GENE.GEZU01037410.1~~GEZU01037410.1.p1  ORF type:complete len:138 (-),score=44.67 GEZU01037410.1:154-567(-)